MYKVQLKNETLNSNEAKASSARVFRAVQGDKTRKGELFGTENLLKFKEDGSFLADVWKKKKASRKRNSSKEFEVHSVEDIASSLSSNQCDELFDPESANGVVANVESQRDNGKVESEDEDETMSASPRNSREEGQGDSKKMQASTKHGQEQAQDGGGVKRSRSESLERESSNDASHEDSLYPDRGDRATLAESDESNPKDSKDASYPDGPSANAQTIDGEQQERPQVDAESSGRRVAESRREEVVEISDGEDNDIANAVNQDALYDAEQGGALYEEGDDGYDEEMGGETQNAYASYVTMQLPENPQDCTFGSDDDGDHNPDQNLARLLNEEDDDLTAQQDSARRRGRAASRRDGAVVPERQEAIHHMEADEAEMQEAVNPMEAAEPRRQVVVLANPHALDERVLRRRSEAQDQEVPVQRQPEAQIAIQLRPEPRDPSKDDFFRSRDARGRIDDHKDNADRGSTVAQKPRTCTEDVDGVENVAMKPKANSPDTEDSDEGSDAKKPSTVNDDDTDGEGGKQSPKKKAAINLFGKTTTASKSKSKGGSGLCIPTYKKPRKKKK